MGAVVGGMGDSKRMSPIDDIDSALKSMGQSVLDLHRLGYVGAVSKVRAFYSEIWVAKKLRRFLPVIDSSDIYLEALKKTIQVKSNRRGDNMNGDAEYYWSIGKRQYEKATFHYLVLLGYDDDLNPLIQQKEFILSYEELVPILRVRSDTISLTRNPQYGMGFYPEVKNRVGQSEYDPADLELSLHPERYTHRWDKIQ